MVFVGMGDEDVPEVELGAMDEVEHVLAVGSGVDRGGFAAAWVPDEETVYPDVTTRSVEHGKSSGKHGLLRVPASLGEDLQRLGVETEMAGDSA